MRSVLRALWLIAIMAPPAAWPVAPARAQSPMTGETGMPQAPAVTLPEHSPEHQQLRRRSPGLSAPSQDKADSPGGWEMRSVILSLLMVVGLILLLRWIGGKFMPAYAGRAAGSLMQVVSRSVIGPRQQLMLIRVGRRLIVVGQGAAGMTPLAEITDPDEVAHLLGQADRSASPSTPNPFASLFARAGSRMSAARMDGNADADMPMDAPPQPEGEEPAAPVSQEVRTLLDRVRSLSRQYRSH